MARTISTILRYTDTVALFLPRRTGKVGFRFGFARNFDGSFTTFQVVPNHGYRSPNVLSTTLPGKISDDQVAFVFRISDYTTNFATLIDGVPLYFRVEAQNPNGSFDAPEAMHLVLPTRNPSGSFVLRGTVPVGAALANSIEIQLPGRCLDWQIKSLGGDNIEVAFDSGGPEYVVIPNTPDGFSLSKTYTSISQLFLRAPASPASMAAIFTINNNPLA